MTDAYVTEDIQTLVSEVLAEAPVLDGHNDLPIQFKHKYGYDVVAADLEADHDDLHTDIPAIRAGGLGAQFWSVFVPSSLEPSVAVVQTLEQIDSVYRMVAAYPDTFVLARTAADVRAAFAAGRVASLMGMEGGHSIDSSLGVLRLMRRLGAGYMTLTHNDNTPWSASATGEPVEYGLTDFGREVVREMNRIGMLVDISHVHEHTMHDALDASSMPVIFSHSSCRAVAGHPRNAPDGVLERLPGNGGVIMITFVPQFINEACWAYSTESGAKRAELGLPARPPRPGLVIEDPEVIKAEAEFDAWKDANPGPVATIADVVAHIEHAREVVGVDHIGLGSDFDGIAAGPEGLGKVSDYPKLLGELAQRGWSAEDLKKLTSGNIVRVLEETEVDWS